MTPPRTRILVIDDDPAILRTIEKILEREGHQVLTAMHGKEGLAIARREEPDLIITDLLMPEMEGIETIQTLREELPDVKILAVSGGGVIDSGTYLTDAEILGADRALAKPFSPSRLSAVVEELLEERAQGEADG